MATNPDELFENIVLALVPLWGPFYAVFYLLRLMWTELTRSNDTK